MDDTTVPLVFRSGHRSERPATPIAKASSPTQMREQDRNWLLDFSATELHSLVDEFATFEIKGKLQPWSRQLLEHGKRFSDRHKISEGGEFRREFLKHLKEEKIEHPKGRSYGSDDLAAVFCMTNNSPPSKCRRFITDEDYRASLRLEQSGNQHKLPLPDVDSGKIP